MDTDLSFFTGTVTGADRERFTGCRQVYAVDGGVSRIYRAVRHGRVFALKSLAPPFDSSPLFQALLRKEYEAGMGMSHPGFATTFSFETVEGIGPCIVREWIEGEPIDAYIGSRSLSTRARLALLLQVTDAVASLHDRQIVHRDLKPANILVTTTGGTVKIIDLGVADGPALEMVKGPGGTMGYAAPEQCREGAVVDHRADIYAFGRILAEMDMFPHTALRCTAVNPSSRPSSMTEVGSMLRREASRRGRIAAVAAATAALIGALVAGIYLMQPQGDAAPDEVAGPAPDAAPPAAVAAIDSLSAAIPDPVHEPRPIAATPPAALGAEPPRPEAEPVTPAAVAAASGGEGDIIRDILPRVAFEAARRRFADHIAMADTLTVASGNYRRFCIRYWRELARRDMALWLADQELPEGLDAEEAAARCRDLISIYSDRHEAEHQEALRRVDERLGPYVVFFTRRVVDELPDGSLEVDTLGDDDLWHRIIEPPRAKRLVNPGLEEWNP